jgi:AraC-like DNA-binding protein
MGIIPDIKFRKQNTSEIGFEIMPLKSLLKRSVSLAPPINQLHRIHFHMLILLTQGKGHHIVDFKSYSLSAGDLLFINKEQVQAFDIENNRDGYVILFTDRFLNKNLSQNDYFAFYRFFTLSKYPPIINFSDSELKEILPTIHSMQNEFNKKDDFAKEEIIRSLLKIFLLSAERTGRLRIQQPESSEFKTFVEFQKLLSKKFIKTRDASNYAKELNLSYRQLNDICKEFTQKTAKSVIDEFIILEAKRKLSQCDISVKEISYSLGFDEPTNFVKYFKKHTGVSPKTFQNHL